MAWPPRLIASISGNSAIPFPSGRGGIVAEWGTSWRSCPCTTGFSDTNASNDINEASHPASGLAHGKSELESVEVGSKVSGAIPTKLVAISLLPLSVVVFQVAKYLCLDLVARRKI